MDKKEYWIKITMEDYGLIPKAYFLAVLFLGTQYPKPAKGRDSEYKKRKRKDNEKVVVELTESHIRFLKTCRETMKEEVK